MIYKKTCVICGKEFETFNTWKKTCSKECSHQNSLACARRSNAANKVVRPPRACPVCGKVIIPDGTRRIYCSDECYRQAISKRRTSERQPKVCRVCGKEIPLDSGRRTYCSEECYRRANSGCSDPMSRPRACPVCGKEFIRTSGFQTYCSLECRLSANRNNPERRARLAKEWKPQIIDKSVPPKVIRASRNAYGDPIATVIQDDSKIEFRGQVAMFYFQRATEE